MRVLNQISHAGFTLTLVDGFIEVSPADQLNQQQRKFLKTHRAEIISELQEEQKILDWLASIGETDPEIIEDTLNRCRADSEALEYFLRRANMPLNTESMRN
ncbi:hypothetical protein [Methylobacter sp. sgz302048]|uniref:hypothetical protein n=1 Tax=Methylobacter sp. sgz302048 TaxID=3455945 RepID=UPI003F9F4508